MRDIKSEFPVGSLVRFVGDNWLSDISGTVALVTGHTVVWGEPAISFLVNGSQLDLPESEISQDEVDLIRVDI
jgi:hypothetical protein